MCGRIFVRPMRPLPIFDEVQIDSWTSLSPETMILNPGTVSGGAARTAAAKALKYSRLKSDASYDDIGFRLSAATPKRGPVPLCTLPWMRWLQRAAEVDQTEEAIPEIAAQEEYIRHRPIDLPDEGGEIRYRFEVKEKLIYFMRPRPHSKARGDEEIWVFPLTSPPQLMLEKCVDRDEGLIFSQKYRADLPGAFWIPLTSIIESGYIRRMQDWREQLQTQTEPARYYCFVSHRWLTPGHPDPDGLQARFIAWQLFAHLCDAIRVAGARGLRKPRRFSAFGFAVGHTGSDLAEALLVNILRPALDDNSLAAAQREARACEEYVHDCGIAAARRDTGLLQLRGILGELPVLSQLVQRISVWYDYGAMPQSPRTLEEDGLFRAAMEHLSALQLVSRTAIVLDETEDYLSRGWCTLESVVADSVSGVKDLLVGSARPVRKEGSVEHHFEMLLEDRPHLIWRAVLDSEVFRVQTPEECLSRLGLAVTERHSVHL